MLQMVGLYRVQLCSWVIIYHHIFKPQWSKTAWNITSFLLPCLLVTANATQLCQPLDVTVFGPVKRSWRKTLDQWRKDYCRKGTRPKTQFPWLLKRLLKTFSPHNLKSGFRATGLFLLDRNQVLKRLPSCNSSFTADAECRSSALNESVFKLVANSLWSRKISRWKISSKRTKNCAGKTNFLLAKYRFWRWCFYFSQQWVRSQGKWWAMG